MALKLISADYYSDFSKTINIVKVDGVIVVGALNEDFINKLNFLNTTVILVDPKIYSENFTQVLIGNEHDAFIAIQHLINKGHKKVGFISGDIERLSFHNNLRAIKKL